MAKFKARARALDMLGRQQIAGIPTAISELFKNAHDAYADIAVVDYFRQDQLFVLRDDGLGMSKADFEERWLTIGTESKVGEKGLDPPPRDTAKPLRPILGEKGIGRLAIAVLGPQVLVLSRPRINHALGNTTVAFVNWHMYELPGINLDEIEIPMKEIRGGTLPAVADIKELIDKVKANLISLRKRIEESEAKSIRGELDAFTADVSQLNLRFDKPKLSDDGSGTQFYVQPADSLLSGLIDSDDSNETASPLTKLLIGFSNTMVPGHERPALFTSFRDHKTSELSEDLISDQAFFSPGEFKSADHHIQGKFDIFGQFRGTVSVYGKQTINHEVQWKNKNRPTACGPFTLNVAYVQGRLTDSRLPPMAYAEIVKKLERVGGLYIYRDGIRVLPYGNNDFDFLDIEKNRTKSASYYFFSYRRMIGAIEIFHANNPQLQEKAGREGFRENRAYLEFKDILKNFFVQIAADFFREGGEKAEAFLGRRAELDKLREARKEREKTSAASRRVFERELDSFFHKVKSGDPQMEADKVTTSAVTEIEQLVANPKGKDVSSELSRIESDTLQKLQEIKFKYVVEKPAGIGLPRQLRRDWEASRLESRKIRSQVIGHAASQLMQRVTTVARKQGISLSAKRRAEHFGREILTSARERATEEKRQTKISLQKFVDGITGISDDLEKSVFSALKTMEGRFHSRLDASLSDEDLSSIRSNFESELEIAIRNGVEGLKSLHEQIDSLHWTRTEDGTFIGITTMNEALEEDVIALRDRAEADLELTQLGMAVSVISHEFESNVNSIRSTLRRLKAWSDKNPQIRNLYEVLRNSFDHLDAYLTLFTPLRRRLYRRKIEFSGADITKFIRELFENRLDRHSIKLEATPTFQAHSIFGFPSTFYPVFVNLVDNAIFWLRDHQKPRLIRFDIRGNALLISDTGPGISSRDRESIFELGFTRKPSGRGLGLYISKEVLDREGYSLSVADVSQSLGTTFVIEPK